MKRILYLLITFVMVIGVFAFQIVSADDNAQNPNNGMVINKTAVYKGDGVYEIMLEAYATGTKVTTSESTDMPTDIILVLDQSSSMAKNFSQATANSWVSYGYRQNSANYSDRANNNQNNASKNLYYKCDDGKYVSVSVVRKQVKSEKYTEISNNVNMYVYSLYRNNLYVMEGDKPIKVTVERQVNNANNDIIYTYTYTDNSNNTISETSNRNNGKAPFTLYRQETVDEDTYTYSYTINDNTTEIGISTGADTVYKTEFYKFIESGSNITALEALQNAVTNFANAVAEKAAGADGIPNTSDDVNHRIAVVGFATGNYAINNYSAYENTELFIGSNQYNYNDSNTTAYYSQAFQNMNTTEGYKNVIDSKNVLDASGATKVDFGIEMANKIFEVNPITGQKRNRVVIVFTDGSPSKWDVFDGDVADSAIINAYTTKNSHGATVYTVGIFSGADGSNPAILSTDDTDSNKFMHLTSSNYPNAKSREVTGEVNPNLNGTSYYLSASNSVALNDIFQKISSQIETGQSSTTLNSSAVVKDIIAPQFQLPEGATANNITLETWKYNGEGNEWSKNNGTMGATATVNTTTGQVDVTGFDFAKNYIVTLTNNGTTEHRGNKLVIKFNVQTKPGFLGGNDVYTNTSAGVYENATATEPVLTFPRPTVNVPIGAVEVTAQDKNVYLLGKLTAEQIKSGATVKCGDVTLDLSKADQNYGLESWQTAYVNITVTYTDASGATLTDLSELKDDTSYTVSATVEPKTLNPTSTQGTKAETKSGDKTGKINVFKPELTYQDSVVYNGDPEPTYDTTNYDSASTVWKHKVDTTETLASGVTMTGTAPTLTFEYKPDSTQIYNSKINATSDKIGVEVKVEINGTDVTDMVYDFKHNCNIVEGCQLTDHYKFWLHILSTSLTIEKKFTNGTVYDANEKFVFTVNGDGVSDLKVTVKANGSVTINNLKVGATYTVTEDTTWGWRYDSTFTVDTETKNIITLTADEEENVIVCTNTLENEKYLTGNAYADNQWKGGPGKNYVNDSSTDEVTPAPTAFSFSNRTVVNNNTAVSQNDAAAAATEAPKKKSIFSIFFGSGNKG